MGFSSDHFMDRPEFLTLLHHVNFNLILFLLELGHLVIFCQQYHVFQIHTSSENRPNFHVKIDA
jgi:hypothetical protein